MKRIILCVLVAASGLAKEQESVAQKPACRAAIHGHFWPETANTDTNAARKLAQCGTLEICTTTGWRYKWQPVTVNVRQLGKAQQELTPACASVMEQLGGASRERDVSATSR
jgi:hypothetical protein